MSLPAIRRALADVLFATPAVPVVGAESAVIGMNQSLAYQPTQPPEIVPCAWLGDSTGDIAQGSYEVWTHALPITVAVYEAGQAEQERQTVEEFMLAVVKQLRGHASITQSAIVTVTAYAQGEIMFQGRPYRGFTLTTAIEEKFEVANDYWPQAS